MESLRIFPDTDTMAQEIASQLELCAGKAKKRGHIFSVVLSGGNTCASLYRAIAEQSIVNEIPWEVIHVFWSDERCVSPENKKSNYGICREVLLDRVLIPKKNIHRIRGEEDPSAESARYAKEVQDHILLRKGQATLFDWTFLGVGSDGHTASIFPGQDSLVSKKLCEKVRHPQSDQIRITLTPLALKKSNRITYHIIGRGKAEIVSGLISGSAGKDSCPAAQVFGEWYLDQAAASYLP